MGYFPRVYASLTLVATCFHVFWEAGRDRVFLVSEPGLLKEDPILIGDLIHVILHCNIDIYYFHDDIEST